MNYAQHMPELPPIEAYDDEFQLGQDVLIDSRHGEVFAQDAQKRSEAGKITFAEPAKAWRINAASDWIEAEIPRRKWIVPSYLMRGKVSVLIGAPEAGKSTVSLKWAISLALDEPFGDYRPCPLPGEQRRPRRVMILNAEDDEEEQQRRISALIRETGRTVASLGDNLIRVRAGSDTAKLFEPGLSTGEISTTEAFTQLQTSIEEMRVDVLILDPLVEMMGGADENSNAVMGSVFAKLRSVAEENQIAILVIHHVRKGEKTNGSLESARGGGALGGSVRCAHTLAVMSDMDADELGIPKDTRRHYVRLDSAKQSYAPPADRAVWMQRFALELANGETAPELRMWQPPQPAAVTLDELALIEAAIKGGTPEGPPYSAKLSADPRSIRHVMVKHGIAARQAQEKVLEALKGAGMVMTPICTVTLPGTSSARPRACVLAIFPPSNGRDGHPRMVPQNQPQMTTKRGNEK